jgi:NADPH:quinone reductase-like Zn-dependent oxidoreductase
MISLLSQDPADGGFQLYSAAVAAKAAKLPSSVSFAEGVVLPLAFDTAAIGLYSPASEGFLGLPMPSLDPKPSGKTIVIWGGSSSVGALTIQLAVASGVKVVTVASQRNFDFCRSLGASEVLDYNKDSIVEDVVNAVKKVGGDYTGVYDAISEQEKSYKYVIPIHEKLGGGNIAVVLAPPEGVKAASIIGINDLTHPLWADYFPKALESGKLKCVPEPMVIGKGLESIQKGMDENKKGVSAKKVVVEL